MRFRKNYHLLIAPLITLLMLGVFFALYGIFPFGNNTVSWCDMNQQTIPLLMDFKDILEGKASIFYSTGNAGGMNFWGVFLFFLASPLYLTVWFVEKSQIIYLVNILLAVKLALSAFTASVYFKKIHKNLKTEYQVVLSVMYALCGYGIMYCQTLVWLDIMALFPLLVLSLHRLCRQGKPIMYGVILSLMMIICFYLSYMIVIYLLLSVPLFIAVCCRKYEKKKASLSFMFASLISALITAPVWFCAFIQTSSSARGGSMLSEIMIKPLFENGANKFSMIACTSLCIAILPFFIKNRICRKKEVKYNLLLMLLLAIPVFIDPINKMWHTGSYQSFPLRYGFIIIFTLLVLSAYYFENISYNVNFSKAFALTAFILGAGFIFLAAYVVSVKKEYLLSFTDSLKINGDAFKILFGLFISSALLYFIFILMQGKKLISGRILCLVFMLVFSGEAFLSFSVNLGYAVSEGGVLKNSASVEYDSSGDPYYRTGTKKKYIHVNMLGGLGYNSLAHYTSLTNEDYMFAMKKLGYSSYWMEVGSNGGTVLTDALMSVKYLLGTHYDFSSYYNITNLDGDLERGESSICCPIGIANESPPENLKLLGGSSRVDIQKNLAEKYFGTDSMIHEYKPVFTADGIFEYKDLKYKVTIDKKENAICQMRYSVDVIGRQNLYFDIFDRLSNDLSEKYYGAAEIYVNGNCITDDYPNQKNNGILSLGEFENTTAEILILINKNINVKSLGVFGIDTDKLDNCVNKIHGCEFYINKNKLNAEYDSNGESWLYMSIPFESGLKASVNGTDTDIVKVNDAFCALKLSDGINEIEISFLPAGMTIAVIMSVLGFTIFIVYFTCYSKKNIDLNVISNFVFRLVMFAFAAVILIIYIFPVILKMSVIIAGFIK